MGHQDRRQAEDRHQGHLLLEHLHLGHQDERHLDHQDEGQNQDVNQGHLGRRYEGHQGQYEDHQDRYEGHQGQGESQDQGVILGQDGIHLGHQDEDRRERHDHQEVEVLVDRRQTLVQEEAEWDEDQHLDHEAACRLEAFQLEACLLEDDLQAVLDEMEAVA